MSIHNDVHLPAPSPFFSCCYGNDRSRYLLVIGQAVKKALDVGRFFSEKLNFFNSKNAQELQKKTPAVAFLKALRTFLKIHCQFTVVVWKRNSTAIFLDSLLVPYKKTNMVWNDMRMTKRWQVFHFCMTTELHMQYSLEEMVISETVC